MYNSRELYIIIYNDACIFQENFILYIFMLYYAICMYRHRKVLKDLHQIISPIYFEGIEDMHNMNTQTMK